MSANTTTTPSHSTATANNSYRRLCRRTKRNSELCLTGCTSTEHAQSESIAVAYLPGLAMRRIAGLHPGEAKADARGAAIIAEAARTMPHTLRGTRVADENVAGLSMLCGYDDDLAKQATATSNRIRGLLT